MREGRSIKPDCWSRSNLCQQRSCLGWLEASLGSPIMLLHSQAAGCNPCSCLMQVLRPAARVHEPAGVHTLPPDSQVPAALALSTAGAAASCRRP